MIFVETSAKEDLFMIIKMIKTGRSAAKKCKKAFKQKAKIMRRKGREIEEKKDAVKERFTKEI